MRRGRRPLSILDDEPQPTLAETPTAPGDTFETFGAEFEHDTGNFGTVDYFFEALMQVVVDGTAKARLFDVTGNAAISGSEVTTTSTSETRVRSSSLSLTAGSRTYRFEVGGVAGKQYRHHRCQLFVED